MRTFKSKKLINIFKLPEKNAWWILKLTGKKTVGWETEKTTTGNNVFMTIKP